ncbi:MAG: SDR family oxidoreductase [Firmicutes bacterium]|jgi:NAD(P)-dependent dehydrogenase (short-subunit alcohol dehydrogenase family)|nr:SDR family oxidoreductase [Bacillota bacterium]
MADLFDVSGQVAVITGGGGVLCSEMARALAARGVKVAVLDINEEQAKAVAGEIKAKGGEAIAIAANVLDKASIERARDIVLENFGTVDILINGAGGNKAEATVNDNMSFFDLPMEAIQWVFNLNIVGTILPTQVFGKIMAEREKGVVINMSSMAAFRPLTRTVAYCAAKAAVSNFTQWMAVHFNHNYSPNIRVNALAPGFFLTEQNYYLLVDKETGEPTQRGNQIISHTPVGRYGEPADLIGTLLWLISDAASFVNGVVVPVDGAFQAYSGV